MNTFNTRCISLFALILSISSVHGQKELPNVQEIFKYDNTQGLPFTLATNDYFGSSVVDLGDLDNNGSNEIVVGALGSDDSRLDVGAIYILFMDGVNIISYKKITPLASVSAGAAFGTSITNLGDLDNNGVPDIAVGAPTDDITDPVSGGFAANMGSVTIYFLDNTGAVINSSFISRNYSGYTPSISEMNSQTQFGSAVENIGDLDNDGIVDLVVGASNDDQGGQVGIGSAFILFLNSNGTVKSHTKIGSGIGLPINNNEFPVNSRFGSAITNVGDIDNDGVNDIIVGAPGHNGNAVVPYAQTSGAVWTVMLNTNGTVKTFKKNAVPLYNRSRIITLGEQFGRSLSLLGDINNDGFQDVAIGSLDYLDGISTVRSTGAFYICSFGHNGSINAMRKFGEGASDFSVNLPVGARFSHYGTAKYTDPNSASLPMVVSGAHMQDDGSGALYITRLQMPNNTNTGTVRKFNEISRYGGEAIGQGQISIASQDQFGFCVSNIGDFNGDGFTDIAVGRPTTDVGGANRGEVDLVYLNENGEHLGYTRINNSSFSGLGNWDFFGSSVTTVGDLDNNGVIDLAVGAQLDDDGSGNSGAVYILFMNANGTVLNTSKISITSGGFTGGVGSGDRFGRSCVNIGDLNNDGVDDLAVGAILDDDGGTDAGAVYILFMNSNGTVASHQKISATQGGFSNPFGSQAHFGQSITNLGDVNNDGVNDIAVGAAMGSSANGAVYIIELYSNGTVKGQKVINSSSIPTLKPSTYFGISVANIGDVNNDGITDIGVGAIKDNDGDPSILESREQGAFWVICFDSTYSVIEYQKISATKGRFNYNPNTQDWFGFSCAALGDIDNDGHLDVVIGANKDDEGGLNSGSVFVTSLFTEKDYIEKPIAAHLKRKLDGGYVVCQDGKLHFKYEEEYEGHGLKYEIYGFNAQPMVTQQDQPLLSVFGENYFTLDLTENGNCLGTGYYTLEVTNSKKEQFYLRFKQVNNICPTTGGNSNSGSNN